MQKEKLSVYVITRFGIGQSLESFYDRELIYIKNFLAKSIEMQKKYITKWIILIDIKTPDHIYKKIKELAPKDLLYIYSEDPFLVGSLKPNITSVLKNVGVKTNDKIVTIRIDADDVFSNDYVYTVLNTLIVNKLINKYEKVLIDAATGVYFYPSKNKLIRVFKKGFSIQALYSIFNNNFISVYDTSHQGLENKITSNGGYCCTLNDRDFWLRSMRHFTASRGRDKVGIFEGRFVFIKEIIKSVLYKFSLSNTTYKEKVSLNDIFDRFQLSKELIETMKEHERKIKNHKIEYSPMIKQIVDLEKTQNTFKLKGILLEMYKKEDSHIRKLEIKKEFYSF
tara:strand:- start:810 stop:1823 length:1014 start_codon:yes stop_codon:yes gene_type:complete